MRITEEIKDEIRRLFDLKERDQEEIDLIARQMLDFALVLSSNVSDSSQN